MLDTTKMKQCPACNKEFKDHLIFCPYDGQSLISDKEEDQFVGTIFDDKYRIDDKVGEGGMGMVFKATHVLMDSTVAIKMLHPHLSSDRMALERFRREARAAAQIRHPNAVAVIDFGVTKNTGIAYLVMEFLEGVDLRMRLKEQKQIGCKDAYYIMQQVCSAVQVAHSRGIIHRDLKPDNIWLLKNYDGADSVKVLDFGIAKLLSYNGGGGGGNTLTQQGMIVGTPYYMSPEQCQGEELDARSDIYSLGIILYEMLTGDVPFRGPTPMVVAHKHITEIPAPLHTRHPEIPQQVEEVIFRALNKGREDRQESALQLGEELEAALIAAGMDITLRGSRTPQSPFSKTIHATTPPETGEYEPTIDALNTPSASGAAKMVQASPAPAAARDQPAPMLRGRRAMIAGALTVLIMGVIAAFIWWPRPTVETTKQPLVAERPVEPIDPPAGMVLIPGGSFIMGNNASDDEAEKPEREVSMKAFYIDQYEVTNEEYYKFVRDTKREPPPGWVNGKYPEGKDKYPVVNVNWSDAAEYARWAGKRLPTEEEWEYAARGKEDKRLYPWGNNFDPKYANAKETGKNAAMPVGNFLAGATQPGALDMVGNVAEWTGSDYKPYPGSKARSSLPGFKMVRGCSFSCGETDLILTRRYSEPADTRRPELGFRCAKDGPSQ
jgi:serine/threonine-protein kinase